MQCAMETLLDPIPLDILVPGETKPEPFRSKRNNNYKTTRDHGIIKRVVKNGHRLCDTLEFLR